MLQQFSAMFSTVVNTILEEYLCHPSVLDIGKRSKQAKYLSFFLFYGVGSDNRLEVCTL